MAASLTSDGDSMLANRILDRFCPGRLRATVRAATGFRDIDLAIRAVLAAAVLHRFGECLDYVRRSSDQASRRLAARGFLPNDLLARMVTLATCSQPRCNSRRSRLCDEDPLFLLVLNEAMWRLGMALPNRRLAKRVHKHMCVCLSVASIAMPHEHKSEQERQVVPLGLRRIPAADLRPRARSLLVDHWQGE